jgi:enterochelin esterase family protein
MEEAVASRPAPPVSQDAVLEEMVRHHLPMVYAAARRQLPDPSLAEDVTQAVFMVLARRWKALRTNVVISSWLMKVTHLTCLQARRGAGRRKSHELRAAKMRPATTPPETMTNGQLAAELDAVLAQLGEGDRSVLVLRYLEQRSVEEVARQLGISEVAAKKRIGRAMARLREKLGVAEEQLAAGSLSVFFMSQHQIALPAQLSAKVVHTMTAGGTAARVGLLGKGVLKAMFWSSIKVPLAIAAVTVIAATASVYLVKQSSLHDVPTSNASLRPAVPIDRTMAAPGNMPGAEYPRLDSHRRALFRIYAPEAKTVAVQIGDTYEMIKAEDGYWTVTTLALAPGFHYYNLVIDGAAVPDPGSGTFLGSSRMLSGLEVPDESEDFARERDVPHGAIRAHYYHSGLSDSTREAIVYTPPSYDARPLARYPVLYLLPGMGENQHAWTEQGHAGAILDNLIAEGRAKEMIVVMEEAGTSGGLAKHGPRGRGRAEYGGNFPQIFTSETVPMIDAAYRTIPDRDHRAIAGASLGGTQVFQITQDSLEQFAYAGAFSAPFAYPAVPEGYDGLLARPDEFKRRVKLLFFSAGAAENLIAAQEFHDQLDNAGIPHVFYEVPRTSPGWQSWRPSLHEMAPLLFQN